MLDDTLPRRHLLRMLLAGTGALAWPGGMGRGQTVESVLRIGMSLSDIPLTTGQASGGHEGNRILGRSLYDALTTWDLSQPDGPPSLIPNLAERWTVDPNDPHVWTFTLRRGIPFHDGSEFTAHDVVWNFEKLLEPDSPQYDRLQARNGANWLVTVQSARALGDYIVEIRTKAPNPYLPHTLSNIFYSSPRRWEQLGRDWTAFASEPSGTGPYKLSQLIPRDRAELVRNPDHWNKDMIPQHDRMVLRPIPDSNTRISALLSGQVDLVESLPPDAVPRVKSSGMQVTSNIYPHCWSYTVSHLPNSPFNDIRIRRAANLAIDRAQLTAILGGFAVPAQGLVTPDHPWFGSPTFRIKYDPDGARALMAEAGYSKSNPVTINLKSTAGGSASMYPLPMNEFIQENFRDIGIRMSVEVADLEAHRSRRIAGANAAMNSGVHAMTYPWNVQDPVYGLIGHVYYGPNRLRGHNWGHFSSPVAEQLAGNAMAAFDVEEQNRRIGDLHAHIIDQAASIYVVHDVAPRGLAAHVKGFVQVQNLFQDYTRIRIER